MSLRIAAVSSIVLLVVAQAGCFGETPNLSVKYWNLSGRDVDVWLNATQMSAGTPMLMAQLHHTISSDNESISLIWSASEHGTYKLDLALGNGTTWESSEAYTPQNGPSILYTFRADRVEYTKSLP